MPVPPSAGSALPYPGVLRGWSAAPTPGASRARASEAGPPRACRSAASSSGTFRGSGTATTPRPPPAAWSAAAARTSSSVIRPVRPVPRTFRQSMPSCCASRRARGLIAGAEAAPAVAEGSRESVPPPGVAALPAGVCPGAAASDAGRAFAAPGGGSPAEVTSGAGPAGGLPSLWPAPSEGAAGAAPVLDPAAGARAAPLPVPSEAAGGAASAPDPCGAAGAAEAGGSSPSASRYPMTVPTATVAPGPERPRECAAARRRRTPPR